MNLKIQILLLLAVGCPGLAAEAPKSSPRRVGKPPGTLRVRPSNILPPLSPLWKRVHRVYEETPAAYSYLQLWTVKPAQFKAALAAMAR